MMFKFNIITGLIFLTTSLYGQQYRLQGRVTNEKNEPVAEAVVLLQMGDSLVSTTLVDAKGDFEIGNLSGGDYKLAVMASDYNLVEEHITLNADRKVAYILYPVVRVDLSEIEVTADRSNVIRQSATGATFYLSATARNTNNPYEALREIPKLVINESERKLQMTDGSTPLLLINGVKTGAGLNAVDPKDIESVEVIDFPSARYLSEGVTTVLNIKLKRKQYNYRSFNASTRHSLPVDFGSTNAYYETGGENYSLYLTGQHFYFSKDKIEYETEQWNANYNKYSRNTGELNIQSFWAALGGDYVFSDKDYLAYSVTYGNYFSPPSESEGNGYILQGGDRSNFEMWTTNRNVYYVNTYNLYHKHSFDKERTLETTLRFNLNGNRLSGEQKELYDNLPAYNYLHDYDNSRISSSLELNYNAMWKEQSLEVGSLTNFRRDRIRQLPLPVFPYRKWSEYLYAGLSGALNERVTYAVSLGTDMIFNRSQDVNNSYVRPAAALSAGYRFNSAHALGLAYRLNNSSPSIANLNPYNTSTDSLYRKVGNPFLLPVRQNTFTANYSFNKSGIYLSPSLSYRLITDNIVESGSMKDNIFTETYINEGSFHEWDGSLTLRYNSAQWGNFGGSAGYKRSYYSQIDRGSFYANVNFYLQYKKMSANGFVFFQRYFYTPLYLMRNYAPESELTLAWRINNNFSLNAGMRYFLGGLKTKTVTESAGYYSTSVGKHADRRFLFNIGFSYYWRNKAQSPQRSKRQLYGAEQGIAL